MIKFSHKGDFSKLNSYFQKLSERKKYEKLKHYGKLGVDALRESTPKDTGKTSESWQYSINISDENIELSWNNTNIVNGVPIAIILQYGHATGSGGWVQGRDYINPALRPIFDKMVEDLWKEMTEV